MRKPEPEALRKVGAALRHWYYSVGVELEMFVAADYPATAHDTIHDALHSVLDHLDRHKHPRVVCNLVANATDWEVQPTIFSLGQLDRKSRVAWPPFTEAQRLQRRK